MAEDSRVRAVREETEKLSKQELAYEKRTGAMDGAKVERVTQATQPKHATLKSDGQGDGCQD